MDIKKYTKCRPFLCLRRGVSDVALRERAGNGFSLPTQRCFSTGVISAFGESLFSAYAEVFPSGARQGQRLTPFLCLRRGVSVANPKNRIVDGFSLPTQRCFQRWRSMGYCCLLFSAYAEVFLVRAMSLKKLPTFLCLRRGVSVTAYGRQAEIIFSLPTQRCFSDAPRWNPVEVLFSAYAEVFPLTVPANFSRSTFLCLRRGVSEVHEFRFSLCHFSLPTQRCFPLRRSVIPFFPLFSAYAEVFPKV